MRARQPTDNPDAISANEKTEHGFYKKNHHYHQFTLETFDGLCGRFCDRVTATTVQRTNYRHSLVTPGYVAGSSVVLKNKIIS